MNGGAGAELTTAFSDAVGALRAGQELGVLVEALLGELTAEEELGLLDGDLEFWPGMTSMLVDGYNRVPLVHGAVERLGLPGLRFSDGPRGVVMGESTAFPVPMARGATWDIGLEERVGTAMGVELRAQGANFFGGVCINLPRHPAWGRAQETYGEDPVLLGELGSACVRGVQPHAMACAKHYALNSMENARFSIDVRADDRTLHEVYLAHFRRVVDEGVDAIMTSYNAVNGEWAGQNEDLLEGILRRGWGFEGVTVSDFIWGLRDAAASLRAGLDVEEPFRQQRALRLAQDLEAGAADWEDVHRAARRIIGTQLRAYARRDPVEPGLDVVFSGEHRDLAREVAARSMVLLQNDGLLPLDGPSLTSLAVIGRLADLPNTGDHGSSDVRSPQVVTPLDGLREALPQTRIVHAHTDDVGSAAAAAGECEVALVVVGYTAEDEGEYIGGAVLASPPLLACFPPTPDGKNVAEQAAAAAPEDTSIVGSQSSGGDRASLRLRPVDEAIITAVAAANPRTVVAVVTAGAVLSEGWREQVPALLLSWYAGCEGGHALADVLLGRVDASGRLPFSIPTDEAHLPFFDRDATEITYDLWFGQRLLDRLAVPAAFPLGFGLSYTTFSLSGLTVSAVPGGIDVAVTVTNSGPREGRHVVQVYARPQGGDDFPSRVLVGFGTVELGPGASQELRLTASVRPLERWTGTGFALSSPSATIEVGSHAGDPAALTSELRLVPADHATA